MHHELVGVRDSYPDADDTDADPNVDQPGQEALVYRLVPRVMEPFTSVFSHRNRFSFSVNRAVAPNKCL